jgi:hypothetical protein
MPGNRIVFDEDALYARAEFVYLVICQPGTFDH